MDNKELIKIAYELGADLNSVGLVVLALQEGIEIGKQETLQAKQIDEEKLDKLALKAYPFEDDSHWNCYQHELQEAYKAGYRKALEE